MGQIEYQSVITLDRYYFYSNLQALTHLGDHNQEVINNEVTFLRYYFCRFFLVGELQSQIVQKDRFFAPDRFTA